MKALVLSGGAMFCAYQAGVWRALQHVFQPDLVVGVSAGALNGWCIAAGCSGETLAEQWLDPRTAALTRPRRLPIASLFNPRGLEQAARTLTSDFTLRMPFGLVVVELPRLRTRLVQAPDITWRHLVASCAVPGGFLPVRLDGRFYCDGGLLCAVPVWAAAEMGATQIVAVNALLPGLPPLLRGFGRAAHRIARESRVEPATGVFTIGPHAPLGSIHDAVVWRKENILRWIEQGERDAREAWSAAA